MIGSKVGDLIGRKRAYRLGLVAYATGALAMALAQSLAPVVIFWAIVGGLGASLMLPAMQSLIHGNFEGAAQKKAYAAVGPLLGGFITTYLTWRLAFALEVVVMTSNTELERLLADEPKATQDEIISINTDARPVALQVALLIPLLAGLINSFRMTRRLSHKPPVFRSVCAEKIGYAPELPHL